MIKFRCKHCSHKIGVKDEHAGRRAKCPKCKEPIRVPRPKPPEDDFELEMVVPSAGGGGDDSGFDLEVVSGPGGVSSDLAALAAMEAGAQAQMASGHAGGAKCPSCGTAAKPGAALCVSCGYNFKSGKKLNTAVAAAPLAGRLGASKATEGDDNGDPPWKNILWGLFLIGVSGFIWWYFWDFENSTDTTRSVNRYIAFLYNLGGKWLASLPFTFIGLFMLIWGIRGKKI
ncbi:hypothetical protein OT109_02465 [Phycisphaeraceae bacterium D3-23]